MIRYRLDDLGRYQFEWLIQSLLKADLGLGVEAWGGRGDQGRDAYCPGTPNFPAKHISSEGPFLFQVKFVENANAAGAKPKGFLLQAVSHEVSKIKARRRSKTWENPKHYVLLTNAALTPSYRKDITAVLKRAVPRVKVHCLGGTDICDMLDTHRSLKRSFPQLLSLRDLDQLLSDIMGKEVLERSRAAVNAASSIASVFAPTEAYNLAFKVLQSHHFAVLEGPPEMGKTAIAWMMALAQLAIGWEAVVCDTPADFFGRYNPATQQIFVADDAFGRTEYDPSRGSRWESQLNRIFRQLNASHWLIWTSRKHILERALKAMDLQGEAQHFPKPGDILIDAGHLSIREKALILYRHAKAVGLAEEAKDLVRNHARTVVNDLDFTPERIRRFIQERLPDLIGNLRSGKLRKEEIITEIRDAIRNPTDRMRKTFRALPISHKWLLIALLEANSRSSKDTIARIYEEHCPVEARQRFDDVIQELAECFLKQTAIAIQSAPSTKYFLIDWIHPSYRDLVIDELRDDPALNKQFMKGMPLEGVKLAISEAGGAKGTRQFPLMNSPESWQLLHERCKELTVKSNSSEIADLLETLVNAASITSAQTARTELVRVIEDVCSEARNRWTQTEARLSPYEFKTYCEASLLIVPLPPIPNIKPSWDDFVEQVIGLVEDEDTDCPDPEPLENWAKMIGILEQYEPRFLKQVGFPLMYATILAQLNDRLMGYLAAGEFFGSAEELRYEAERLDLIGRSIDDLCSFHPANHTALTETATRIRKMAKSLDEEADEKEESEPDYDPVSSEHDADSFDVKSLFSDL